MLRALSLVALAALGCGTKRRQGRTNDGGAFQSIGAPVFGGGAAAGGADEIEPNDDVDVATRLVLGGTVHARIDPESDVDFFRIDVASDGALAVEVSAVDDADLSLELRDASGTLLARSDRGAAHTKEGVPNLGVTAGRYVAIVRGKRTGGKSKAAAPTLPLGYEITAHIAQPAEAAPNTEREPDDDRGTANDLIIGDSAVGYIGWSGDADVWKLSVEALSANNAIDVEIAAVEGIAFTLEVSDGLGRPLVVRKAPRGAGLVLRGLVPSVPPRASPYHYLTLRATPSNPETAYSLRVSAKNPDPDSEIEPNDTPETAMPIASDRAVVTGHWSPGDVDCYAIAADPRPRTLDVVIATPREADFAAELVVDGKVIGKSDVKGKGAVEKLTGPVPANGRAVVRILGSDNGSEGRYTITLGEGPRER